MQKVAIHTLSLAFSPLSNQECEWLKDDPDVHALHNESKLYMIGQRVEVKFEKYILNEAEGCITFDLICGSDSIKNVRLPMEQFIQKASSDSLLAEIGPKMIRIRKAEEGKNLEECKVVHWLTPDRLFTFYAQGILEVEGLENYRKFTTVDLHYVGLSRRNDSFSRLFRTAHENRSRILGNETQITPTARLTDELMIFMFNVEDMQIVSMGIEDLNEADLNYEIHPLPPAQLAADAEKAFIKILKSEYNLERYEKYPRSSDGLFNSGFARYGFVLNECYSFKTETATIKGARYYDFNRADQPDLILVEGETVRLIKTGSMNADIENHEEK
ncbi:hypothetical protein GCM10023213_24170 [Prosthecobacter algae]|uniref:DUF38 domain-containing protein n=1 Tax=Prosthecobacter algae TaxID=1144682 RepID=A0ABP9P638_9BACT